MTSRCSTLTNITYCLLHIWPQIYRTGKIWALSTKYCTWKHDAAATPTDNTHIQSKRINLLSDLFAEKKIKRYRLPKHFLFVRISRSNVSTIFHFIFSVLFVVMLASRYICPKYVDHVEKIISQPRSMAKRLTISVLVIL